MSFTFYRFEKWFFDILTEDQEYTIIFLSLIQLMGMKICYLAIDHGRYENKLPKFLGFGTRLKLIKRSGNTFITDKGVIKIGKNKSSFDLESHDLKIKMDVKSQSPVTSGIPGLLIRRSKSQYLNWKPLVLKDHTRGEIFMNNTSLLVEGKGYVDYLTSTFQPFGIPVNTLYWGRVHAEEFDLTYSYAEGKAGNYQAALIYHSGKKSRQLEILHLQPAEFAYLEEARTSCPTSYRLLAKSRDLRLSMEIRHLKLAIASSFSDISGRIGSSLLKKLLRDPRGGKFFSLARVEITEEGHRQVIEDLMIIDEYIVFSG